MERHHEKRRDMARSILPSKNREAARSDLARTKRAHRHSIAQELRALGAPHPLARPSGSDVVDLWDERRDLGRYPYGEIGSTVRLRRRGDKLNHFIRWAIATTADLPIDDRLSYLRSVLPGGLIGDHAMSHLADEPDLRRPREHDWRYRRVRWSVRQFEQKARLASEFVVLREILHSALDAPGGLKDLNRMMKTCDHHATHDGCVEAMCVKRCLGGRHDIDLFLRDLYDPVRRDIRNPGPESLPVRRFRAYLRALSAV